MTQWTEEGYCLSIKKHGERGFVLALLTKEHGRFNGYGIAKNLPQIGDYISANWSARLEEQLGRFKYEHLKSPCLKFFDTPLPLLAFHSAATLTNALLPERHPYPDVFEGFSLLLNQLNTSSWQEAYIDYELLLLKELGFGLELTKCTVTKKTQDLVYVSPKSGHAVSKEAGAPYKDKLLTLPAFLLSNSNAPTATEIIAGLDLTGYFLKKHTHNNQIANGAQGSFQPRARLYNLLLKQVNKLEIL